MKGYDEIDQALQMGMGCVKECQKDKFRVAIRSLIYIEERLNNTIEFAYAKERQLIQATVEQDKQKRIADSLHDKLREAQIESAELRVSIINARKILRNALKALAYKRKTLKKRGTPARLAGE